MKDDELIHAAAPIATLAEAFGIDRAALAAREAPALLRYAAELDPTGVRLTWDAARDAVRVYGAALRCEVRNGGVEVLVVDGGLTPTRVADFMSELPDYAALSIELELNKGALTAPLFPAAGGHPYRCALFLFPGSAERAFDRGLTDVEDLLWPKDAAGKPAADGKLIVLVPDEGFRLDGDWLAVVGGAHLTRWRDLAPVAAGPAAELETARQECRDRCSWRDFDVAVLTPLHFALTGTAPDTELARLLASHAAGLVFAYTARSTRRLMPHQALAFTFADAVNPVEVIEAGRGLGQPPDAAATLRRLGALFRWTYDGQWTATKLSLLQTVLVRRLGSAPAADRYAALLAELDSVQQDLDWQWQTFVDSKVDAFLQHERALEDYVATTTQAVSDQVSALVKSVSDTALAAVAALIASLIASLYKDKPNVALFRYGMIGYALHVAVLPGWCGMRSAWTRYTLLMQDTNDRLARFRATLRGTRVDDIAGAALRRSTARFKRYYWLFCVVLIVIVALALLAAWQADQVVPA